MSYISFNFTPSAPFGLFIVDYRWEWEWEYGVVPVVT